MTHTTDPPISSATDDQRSTLGTAVQSYNWTRRVTPGVRDFLTTWLEIGDRAIRHVNIPAPGGAR
jgi:hypothetical protein